MVWLGNLDYRSHRDKLSDEMMIEMEWTSLPMGSIWGEAWIYIVGKSPVQDQPICLYTAYGIHGSSFQAF